MDEWNLAWVANYAEMAMLIAPRPFMVERGHFDGVGVDEMVAYEYAKTKRRYDLLGIGDRCRCYEHNACRRRHQQPEREHRRVDDERVSG